ncbi:hypothetical protein D3C81_1083870 [compost metagenome]
MEESNPAGMISVNSVIKAAIARASSAAIGRVSVFLLEANVVVVCIKKFLKSKLSQPFAERYPTVCSLAKRRKIGNNSQHI